MSYLGVSRAKIKKLNNNITCVFHSEENSEGYKTSPLYSVMCMHKQLLGGATVDEFISGWKGNGMFEI